MRLRKLRDDQGLTQAQVAESLHLTVHYVNALEKDDYQKLPGKIFVKGYFKTYALLLDADPDPILKSFEDLCELREDFKPVQRPSQRRSSGDGSHLWLWAAAGIILIGLFVSWWFWGRNNELKAAALSLVPDYIAAAESASRSNHNTLVDMPRVIRVQNAVTADAVMLTGLKDIGLVDEPVEAVEIPRALADPGNSQSSSARPAIDWQTLTGFGG